jgi:aryl-alcohol dehydrogenase-like predicted oxidoreductase
LTLAISWAILRQCRLISGANQGQDIIPIAGMNKPERVKDNLRVLQIVATQIELKNINEAFSSGAIKGERHPAALVGSVAS